MKISKKTGQALIFMGIGLILILLAVLMHEIHLIETKKHFLVLANEIIAGLLSHLGIGFLAIGIISTMLDMGHWAHYFEERLSKIVIDKKYLRNLDQTALISLQTEVLKSYFKNDDIGGSEGFLRHYQKNIQSIIGQPYRENVNMNLNITLSSEHPDCLQIHETLSYACKSNSGKIQENICYMPEPDEHFETIDFSVALQHDRLTGDDCTNGKKQFTLNDLIVSKACDEAKNGFDLSIKTFNYSGLMVTVQATYLIKKNRFFAWRMAQPSKGITINIKYPTEFFIAKEYFINNIHMINETTENLIGSYYCTVNGWLMPEEGLTFQLLEKKIKDSQ